MNSQSIRLVAAAACFATIVSRAPADVLHMGPGLTSLEFVTVGNPGNASDTRLMRDGTTGYGAVGYAYRMGTFEVTAAQYTEFLNAVAKDDTYGLYYSSMGNPAVSGCNIQQSGSPGSYGYTLASDWANRPVNYVSFANAARFCNWLNNGQPSGRQDSTTTEAGAYYVNGATDDYATSNAALLTMTRSAAARYVIPTDDEWYKAAFHKNDGLTGDYWAYPTQSNTAPVGEAPPGQSESPGSANYLSAIGAPYHLTEVGAYADSASAYGTFDQGGNLWEWNEAVMSPHYRGMRGGSFLSNDTISLRADGRYGFSPVDEYNFIGFRVAEVPEPSTIGLTASCLLALGGMTFLRRKAATP